MLFSEGVGKGRISIHQFVELTSTNAAKLYGLYPKKGSITIGSDADLIIWDQDRELIINNELLHHNVDYTPYEGMKIKGWPALTMSRGEVVWADGEVKATVGRGEFIPCKLSDAAKPKR